MIDRIIYKFCGFLDNMAAEAHARRKLDTKTSRLDTL